MAIRVIIYRELDNGRLEKVQSEDVPDGTDVEGAAWTQATRRTGNQALPAGRFTVARAGKRYRRDQTTQWTNAAVGTAT
jgi:hypothetical protein